MDSNIKNEIIGLTQDLVEFQTYHEGFEGFNDRSEVDDCLDYIAGYFDDTDLHIQRYGHEGQEFTGDAFQHYDHEIYENPKPSMVISTDETLEPKYLLHGHIDVIAPNADNYLVNNQGLSEGEFPTEEDSEEIQKQAHFEPHIEGDRMYGRGTSDMKLGVASLMKLMKDLENEDAPSTSLMVVSDEEQGGFRGAGYLFRDVGYDPEFTISAEPSSSEEGFMVVYKQKGNFQLDVELEGESAHGSKPWEGECANRKLMEFLYNLEERFPESSEEDQWHTTLNIGYMEGGAESRTSIPEQAKALMGIRFAEDYHPNQIMRDVADILGSNIEGETAEEIAAELSSKDELEYGFNINNNEPMQLNEKDDPFIQRLSAIAEEVTGKEHEPVRKNGASDARFATLDGRSGITFGPRGSNDHGKNEYADLTSIEPFYTTLRRFVTEE